MKGLTRKYENKIELNKINLDLSSKPRNICGKGMDICTCHVLSGTTL